MTLQLVVMVIGTGVFLAIPLLVLWLLVRGLRTGVFQGRRKLYIRAEEPFAFWFTAWQHGLTFLFIVGVEVYFIVTVRSF